MKKKPTTKNSTKTSSTNTSTTSSSKTNKNKNIPQKNKINNNTPNKNSINIEKKPEPNKEKIILDFKEILKPSLTQNINYNLYLELMNNLDKKDDIKSLAICRLILAQDPNNEKIKELNDLLFKSIEKSYKENGNQLVEYKEESMDKHMKLNKDGEYEYFFSDESEEED